MNKSISLIALLAASALAEECDPAFQCTLYDAKNFDESNGYYSFCMKKTDAGEYDTSSAFSFTDTEYGSFKPEEFASFKCGSKVKMNLCSGEADTYTNYNYYYKNSCKEG